MLSARRTLQHSRRCSVRMFVGGVNEGGHVDHGCASMMARAAGTASSAIGTRQLRSNRRRWRSRRSGTMASGPHGKAFASSSMGIVNFLNAAISIKVARPRSVRSRMLGLAVYPRLIAKGSMKEGAAAREIALI